MKRGLIKRIITATLAAVTLTASVTGLPEQTAVYAAEVSATEIQPEESVDALMGEEDDATYEAIKASAVQLTPGVTREDALQSRSDEKWYKFTVPKGAGYSVIDFAGVNAQTSTGDEPLWQVSMFEEQRLDYNSRLYWSGVNKGMSKKLTLVPGSYYIRIGYESCASNQTYTIKVTYTADSSYESEDNNSKEKANLITSGKTYYGNVTEYFDRCDFYKIVVANDGYISLDFGQPDSIDKERKFDIYVVDMDRNRLFCVTYISSLNACRIPCKKGSYYLQIDANSYHDNVYSEYYLKATTVKAPMMEYESNDTYKTANNIKEGISYRGAFQFEEDDEDWYKLKVTNPGVVCVNFKKDSSDFCGDFGGRWQIQTGKGWKIQIYRSDGSTLVKQTSTTNQANVRFSAAKGTYYIRIYSDELWTTNKPLGQTYCIKATCQKAPAAVKITSATGGKKRATIKWTKSADANGYYIYRATSKKGTYRKIATITKKTTVKYTDKKALKSKKTYYYKIVAYKKISGLTAASSASKIKGVKIK